MLGSDDSNEDIDHIPKTPGPPVVSDHESDDDKSDDQKDDKEVEDVKNRDNDSDSESDSSSSESNSSVDNNTNTRNDSEVERSDNENEEMDENKGTTDMNEAIEANDGLSSDENEDKDDKNVNEIQDNESDEEVVRRVSPKKNKRKFEENSDSSDDSNDGSDKRRKLEINENEDNEEKNEEIEERDEEMADKSSAKATDIFGEMSSEDEDEEEDNERPKESQKGDERDSDKESVNENKDNERRDEESGDEDVAKNDETVGEQAFIEEEEPAEEPIPETRIEVEIPRIVADLGKEVHFVKLPNFLSIDTHPYDPQWYEDEIDEDENLDDEGRARLKLKVENTVRWRNVVDKELNELKKESNTRVVRWSDGTYSLHLGEEIFDIHKQNLMAGDNNHLFIRQGTGLQGQTVFRTKLTFRPFSTESFTHRKLTLSLADRSQKTQKIRVLPNVGKDPEAHRTEMIKKEEDRLKASIRREHKQRRVRERSLVRGPTASYLEPDGDEDDEEEGISIARIKNQFKRGSFSKYTDEPELSAEESKPANEEEDDDEDSDFEKQLKSGKSRPKGRHISDSDEEPTND